MKGFAVPKGMKVKKPNREPDMVSKRGIPYWFGPDWVRMAGESCSRIIPLVFTKGNEEGVALHMLSKDGNISYIRGSIQEEFKAWHQDQQLDAILLGFDEANIINTNWQYE